MDGFQKIQLSSTGDSTAVAKKRKKSHPILRILGILLLVVIIAVTVLAAVMYAPAKNLYASIQKTEATAKELKAVAKTQDIDAAQAKLKALQADLTDVNTNLSKFTWIGLIPFVGPYEKDAQHLVNAGIAGVQGGQITVDTLVPYSDLLGLKGKSNFVSGSADDRIKLAVQTLDKITPNIDKIAEKIEIAQKEFDQVDPERYPEQVGKYKVKSQLQSAKQLFADTAELFVKAQPLLKKTPDLLGNKSTKRYLMIFQNDAELRATGGFITAYALFKVDNGKLQVEKADDIYKLDAQKTKKTPAPNPVLKYHQNVFTLELRDNNLSPDYMVSMKSFEDQLKGSVPDFPNYDGIISLDTRVLVEAIKILGDFNIAGRTFSAETDKRCDCPKAIYELEDYSSKPVAYVREERKDIIGTLLYQIMQRALGVSPGKYWGRLFQMGLEQSNQKHVLFYFHDPDAQKGVESLDWAGRIMPYEGDYLHISDVNFAGAKTNLFVKHEVKQNIEIASDGTVTKTLTIDYKDPTPASNCNLEAGQLCLNGILRNWLRIYVPQGSKLMDFKGSEKNTVTYDELGKTVFEGFMTVKPLGAAQVVVKYTLPFKVNDMYKLFIQKQPGTYDQLYTILKNGRQVQQFTQLTDQEVHFKK
jgi:hypothetical protein